MKALSVKQPWASLIASGKKTLEVRTWTTNHRGPLVIVASQDADDAACALHFPGVDLPRGVTVALVGLRDVREGTPSDRDRALCDAEGSFVWELESPRPLEPAAVKGQLNLYDIDDVLVAPAASTSLALGGMPAPVVTPPLAATNPAVPAPAGPPPKITVAVKPPSGGHTKKPYVHQTAAWDHLDRHFDLDGKHGGGKPAGMLVVPTGGGKTYIAASWLLRHHVARGGRVLWLTHRRNLLVQAFNTFIEEAHEALPKERLKLVRISMEDARWSMVTDDDVVFSTIQTAARQTNADFLADLATSERGLFVVVDEAHHAAAHSYRRVLQMLAEHPGHRVLGLSATPVRSDDNDEKHLWKIFRNIVYQVDKHTLIEAGILARPVTETVETKVDFEREFTPADYAHLDRYGDLAPRVLERLAQHAHRNQLIADHFEKNKDKYGKTIIFGANVLHSRTLSDELCKRGIDADYVDYTRLDSSQVMREYRETPRPQVIANVEMLTEGFDAPKTRTVIIARPTQSEALLSQMVGRALRGKQAGGNEIAYLVTFVDTWSQFHPLDGEYIVGGTDAVDVPPKSVVHGPLAIIPHELIMEAYKLLLSNVRGDFVGLYQCLPHAWRRWHREFENGEVQSRSVLVFDNQVEGFARLDADYSSKEAIPVEITEDLARDLVQRYFGECQDPLPRWQDIKELLEAKRDELTVEAYTFAEKEAFDPAKLARDFYERDLSQRAMDDELRDRWDGNAVCRMVYRDDVQTFRDEVFDRLQTIRRPTGPKPEPEIINAVPVRLRDWPDGERGYDLDAILVRVVGEKKHFPHEPPTVSHVAFSKQHQTARWGFFRYSDSAMVINRTMNSPDVPLFVLEFLVYHEALHADMPNAVHNKDFRERERRFVPSEAARADAAGRGITAAPGEGGWRVRAEQFFDTFQERFFVGRKVAM